MGDESIRPPPDTAGANVFKHSEALPAGTPIVRGYDFAAAPAVDYDDLFRSLSVTGFQASNFGAAIAEVNSMLAWRLSDEAVREDDGDEHRDPRFRAQCRTKVFLGYTSNLVSSGVRETIRFLTQHKMVDVLVTTAGGVEEDIIKCLAPTFMGSFALQGKGLRARGLNRTGNLLVPNDNYCKFEEFMSPLLTQLLGEQREQGVLWTPSKLIARLGKEIDHPDSICYWAQKNGIPIYCPSITDGSLGDMIYFHSFRNPGLVIDLVEDIRRMNGEAVHAAPRKTGAIILGGGLPKHHINNANLMKNGCDFSVYINTAQEYDGSDSGARPDEAVSWGKINGTATPVKVHCDATILFPLLVAQTFAKQVGPSKTANGSVSALGS